MKKALHFCLSLFFLVSINTLFAKEIPITAAEKLVATVIQRNAGPALKNARNLSVTQRFTKAVDGKANFHVFNLSPTGFVIIAGDDRYNAVLAFSDESNIDLSSEEAYIGLWGTLSLHEERIQYIRANNLIASAAVKNEWKTLRNREVNVSRRNGVVVAPLTTTKWNQGTYYNAECPANAETAESGPDGRTYCGCGPIAMAQLIKFHNYPVTGNGSNSYVDPIYGEQTADFCSTDYNWANMPDELTAPNADVAKLIYHMGVATFTYYSTDYTETYLSYMRDAFVNNFGFDQSANWFYDANGDFNWVARNDLDRGRPLLLSGVSKFGGAHTWVADGYGYFDASGGAGETEYFHFNWGWGGSNNGWFLDTDESWFPREDESNNAEITYYFDRYVVQNLFPASDGCQSPESFYANGAENDGIYLNVNYTSGEQDISFRYRKLGTTQWIETPTTADFFYRATGLDLASEYEFQSRRRCCPSDWSPYSESQTFATAGFVPCTPLAAEGLSADVLSDETAYIYTVQPFGPAVNQFRYRPIGTEEWSFTDNATTHFRFLSELLAGTTYEVQVSQECSNGGFTSYSDSFSFSTTGAQTGDEEDDTDNGEEEDDVDNGNGDNSTDETTTNTDCAVIDGDDLTTSSITETYAYVYTPQPFGAVNNQFRYRKAGTTDWNTTDIATTYYRFLADLAAGTTYEFQVRQECKTDSWSNFSTSNQFTTTGTATTETEDTEDEDDADDTEENEENTGDEHAEEVEGNGEEEATEEEEVNEEEEAIESDCDNIDVSQMFTSSIGNHNAYVYTPQPFGAVNNQFRYRPVGTTSWALTEMSTLYYRYLSDLSLGTSYEFQVRHECIANKWSNFSASANFTTTGNSTNSRISPILPAPLTLNELTVVNPQAYSSSTLDNNALTVFPNPTDGLLNLTLEQPLKIATQIRIYDKMGRSLKEVTFSPLDPSLQINVSDLISGVYLIQIQLENETLSKRFMVL